MKQMLQSNREKGKTTITMQRVLMKQDVSYRHTNSLFKNLTVNVLFC